MVKSFFIFAAVRRQAGEDRTGGAVRPATACAACGVHAAGHWNGCAGAILRLRRLRCSSPKPTPPWFLRTAVFCKCTFKKILVDTFSPIWYNILSITPVISENLRILVYDFTIFVRLHNFFPLFCACLTRAGGSVLPPATSADSQIFVRGLTKFSLAWQYPFALKYRKGTDRLAGAFAILRVAG